MAIVQVKDAEGSVLDWMVAKCEGTPAVRMFENSKGFRVYKNESMKMQGINFAPSTTWSQGGPIMDWLMAQGAEMRQGGPSAGNQRCWFKLDSQTFYSHGPIPLVAAMRCYVVYKLGDKVEVPDELI